MFRKFVLFFLLLSFYFTYGQKKPDFKPCFYKDTVSGKLFWNKALPAYLTISPTPNPNSGIQLESHKTKQYADPFYFDTEGINYIRTRWAVDKKTKRTVPNVEIVWEVYADSRSPITKIHLLDKDKHFVDGKLYCSKNLKIVLTSIDEMSGVKKIFYSINGADYQPFTDTIALEKQGNFEIKYFAVDNVNNVEQTHTISFVNDFTPPQTRSIITGIYLGRENIISTTTNIFLRSTDDISGVRATFYRIDSSAWILYKPRTRISIASLSDGRHVLQFYSVDHVNNKEPIQTFKFYLDKTAPITVADVLGDKFVVNNKVFFSGRTKMKLTSVDNKSGVKGVFYSIDNKPFQRYDGPFYLPSTPGWHTVKYFALDSTENVTKDELTKSYFQYRMKVDKVYMDLSGPRLSYVISGNQYRRSDTVFISPKTKIVLSALDPESGVKKVSYYIDNSKTEKPYTGPFTLADINAGLHKVNVVGYDNVNNRNVKTFEVFLDKKPPKIIYNFDIEPLGQKNSLPIFVPNTKIFLSFIDDYTGTSMIYYSKNSGPKTLYHNYITGFKKGKNTISVEVYDKVGNKATKNISFYIK